jgi:hypothetical protein
LSTLRQPPFSQEDNKLEHAILQNRGNHDTIHPHLLYTVGLNPAGTSPGNLSLYPHDRYDKIKHPPSRYRCRTGNAHIRHTASDLNLFEAERSVRIHSIPIFVEPSVHKLWGKWIPVPLTKGRVSDERVDNECNVFVTGCTGVRGQ